MANEVEFDLDAKQFAKAVGGFGPTLYANLRGAFESIGAEMVARMMEQTSKKGVKPGKRSPRRDGLSSRTGALRRSFDWKAEGSNLDSLSLYIFSTSPYAPIHEFGGTIRPKTKRALTIPLPAAYTPGGELRETAGQMLARNAPTFILKKPGMKNPLIMSTEGGGLRAMFVLAGSVKIPARLGFLRTWSEAAKTWASDMLNEAIENATFGLGPGGRAVGGPKRDPQTGRFLGGGG